MLLDPVPSYLTIINDDTSTTERSAHNGLFRRSPSTAFICLMNEWSFNLGRQTIVHLDPYL